MEDRRGREFRFTHDGVRVGPDATIIVADREIRSAGFAEGYRRVSINEFVDYLEGSTPLSNDEALRYVDIMEYTTDATLSVGSVARIKGSMMRMYARFREMSRFNQYVFQVC